MTFSIENFRKTMHDLVSDINRMCMFLTNFDVDIPTLAVKECHR